jgi:uncharacterized protein YraI
MSISHVHPSLSSSTHPPRPASSQCQITGSSRLCATVLLFLLLLLAACGPEPESVESDQLTAETLRIAADYQANGNLDQVQAQLQELQVANANQWLIYVTETTIQENGDAAAIAGLIGLLEALGLESVTVTQYAVQNNLLAAGQAVTAGVQTDTQNGVMAPVATQQTLGESAASPQPSATAVWSTPTNPPAPIDLLQAKPLAKATDLLNVRSGPGTGYDLAGALQEAETVEIIGKNPAGDWWQVQLANGQQGWVLGQLVTTTGDTVSIAVAAIPPAPTTIPAPVAVAEAPIAPAPETQPTAPPTAAPNPNDIPHFTLISKRLWNKDENDGCVGKHLLRIQVLDANGNPLNGVRLRGIYTGEELVTGEQGKGDGIIEYDLYNNGEGFTVIRNNDGREATSDRSEGFTTRSVDIPTDLLIPAGYCTNQEDCQIFYDSWGCQGHHSWEAIFQRNY